MPDTVLTNLHVVFYLVLKESFVVPLNVITQMRKLRRRKNQQLAQGYIAVINLH